MVRTALAAATRCTKAQQVTTSGTMMAIVIQRALRSSRIHRPSFSDGRFRCRIVQVQTKTAKKQDQMISAVPRKLGEPIQPVRCTSVEFADIRRIF